MYVYVTFFSPDSAGKAKHLLKTQGLSDGNFISANFVTVSNNILYIILCINIHVFNDSVQDVKTLKYIRLQFVKYYSLA